ncbi:unnamed protein product [Euphydryas editha]|uniref:Reverse transcriptase domain-containing protein n=1 Tax=Euphydryas editha TaxID=104508 RepID=A0AAU9UEX5_EUPED|nr:unnamed protein product [Euphydryas editha]
MGDLNARVGSGEVPGTVGKFGLGARNERGDLLVQFCQEKELVIANTLFQLPPRRLYTWTSPAHMKDNIVRNQIDYVMLNKRFRNSIKCAKTYPGADIGSDHHPVIVDLSCQLKYILKSKSQSKGIDVQKLREPNVRIRVYNHINEWAVVNKNTNDPREIWTSLKSKFSIINHKLICRSGVRKKQVWMTDEIIDLIEERRLHKTSNIVKYKELDRQIRNKCRTTRLQWYESRCEKIELLMKRHDSFQLHKEIKDMANLHRKRRQTFLTDNMGNIILDPQLRKKHWENYVEVMFSDSTRGVMGDYNPTTGPNILRSEVQRALHRAKTGKAFGPDEITCDVLKLLEHDNIDALTNMFNLIYDSGEIPDDWLKSVFITLPKKPNARKCSDYRTISLMSHVLKIFLSIIHDRIRAKCDDQLGASQFGFRSGMGTREAQFALNVLVQKCRDKQRNVYLCFIDYEKAFDRVKHEELMNILENIGLDDKDLRIIRSLYWNQSATVRVDGEQTDPISIQRGVRQGCIMSPILFNCCSEVIVKEALEDVEHGVVINGQFMNNIRYADDTVLIASTEEGLCEIVNRVSLHSKKFGLNMNVSKTKVMVISHSQKILANIQVDGITLENVDKYRYLGSWLTDTWESDTEIRARIEVARASFTNMQKVLCCRQLSIELRTRLLQCYIWPVVLYGCEAWTIKAELRKKIEAFEMWSYRRMLRISWTDKVTNLEVLRRMGKNLELIRTIKQRKTAYLGHVLRHDRYSLLQIIMMGNVPGKRKPGRRKMSWLHNIREWTGIKTVEQLFRLALDKEKYKKLTANLQ